jgi:predicted component of type VI protein secretion system
MEEDYLEQGESRIEELLNTFRKNSIQQFVDSCYEAYDLIKKEGIKEEAYEDREEIRKALRKMLALFESREEYEKCSEVSWILESEFPGFETTPDHAYIEEMEL